MQVGGGSARGAVPGGEEWWRRSENRRGMGWVRQSRLGPQHPFISQTVERVLCAERQVRGGKTRPGHTCRELLPSRGPPHSRPRMDGRTDGRTNKQAPAPDWPNHAAPEPGSRGLGPEMRISAGAFLPPLGVRAPAPPAPRWEMGRTASALRPFLICPTGACRFRPPRGTGSITRNASRYKISFRPGAKRRPRQISPAGRRREAAARGPRLGGGAGRDSIGGGAGRDRRGGGGPGGRGVTCRARAEPPPRPLLARSLARSLAQRKTLRRFKNGTSAA